MKIKKSIFMIIIILFLIGIVKLYGYLTQSSIYEGNIDWLKDTKFAHRGLHDEVVPENSMPAFENAIKNNYGIELDVLLTKDNKVVVFHDENLQRMTGINKDVGDTLYSEIENLNLLDTDEKIPLLSEVLELIDGKVPMLIEIKESDNNDILSNEVYKQAKNYNGKYTIQSFNPFVLEWFRMNAPNIIRGQLVSKSYDNVDLKWYEKFILNNMLLNFKSRPNYIAYEINSLPNLRVGQLKQKGAVVLSWTITNKEELNKAYEYSDNIIFEKILP